ncbi:MAG: hypothetical protein KQH63_18675 [Desulfobulbaceae bacterium]|nr:hypothetical protein [Desulfobulbaceae bacterium]
MSRGHDLHKARLDAVASLGKTLVRRSGSKCELCEVAGESLRPVEIPPLPEEPDSEHAILVCSECRHGVEGGHLDQQRWRFLESIIWSDVSPVQVAAVRLCRSLSAEDCEWASALLDNLYISPEIEEWVGKG